MHSDVQLVSDGDGLAVIGPETAVERFVRSAGLWASSRELDLRRLEPLMSFGSGVATAAAEAAADSGRWIKLTDKSARLVKEHGLMASESPGQSHLMIGVPGKVQNWLQTETGPGTYVTNPAALSGLGGLMAQAALRQSMAEVVDYLAGIDQKVDDVIRKIDDAVVAEMVGAGEAIERVLAIREETGSVNETLWSTIASTHQTVGATRAYALAQLDAITAKLESSNVGSLAKTAAEAEDEVPKWLAVLARCFQMEFGLGVLELDRVLAASPHELDDYRRGLMKTQQTRRAIVAGQTERLLGRMDVAVGAAMTKMVWNRTRSLTVVEAANNLSTDVDAFHDLLEIESDSQRWDVRRLGRVEDVGSQAIQMVRDRGPAIGTASLGLFGLAAASKNRQGEPPPEE